MAAPEAEASFSAGDFVTLHGLSTAVLNGATAVVEPASAETTSRGRVGVRVLGPPAAVKAHPSAAVKPANLRRCAGNELATLYTRDLWSHLQSELRDASLALEAATDVSSAAAADAPLARLRAATQQADAALSYLENTANALPRNTEAAERDGLIALYAFLLATTCSNIAAGCAMLGDSRGQLAALEKSFKRSLQRGFMPVASAQYGQAGMVQDACLRYGEALRVAGRPRDAVAPLRLAARVAGAEEDEGTEAAAQGTLCSVLLGLSELQPAEQAGEREVALLESAEGPAFSAVALARARVGLGNVKHARAAAVAGSPEADELAAQAEALAADAIAAVPARVRADEAALWAEVACGVCTLRGYLARLRGDLEAAAKQYSAALDAAMHGVGGAGGARSASGARPLPSDAAVAPHGLLERVHAELAAAARDRGDAAMAATHGTEAVTHRAALFRLLDKPLPAECAVCTEAVHADVANADVAMLPCMHVFHSRCLDEWLLKRLQGTCPLCRAWSVTAGHDDVAQVRETVQALEMAGANVTFMRGPRQL